MYVRHFFGFIILMTILLVSGCDSSEGTGGQQEKKELLISAAVSLTDALNEIKSVYELENDVTLTFNLGGSGTLTQQIQQGAPVDVFISANKKWMDVLQEKNLILAHTLRNVTGNQIVLIANKNSAFEFHSFENMSANEVDQAAIGNPDSVPAGQYTQEILNNLNKWNEFESKFVFAKDVRQVLTYVETGNADIGFVYESDAIVSDKIKILAIADEQLHTPIIYPAAVTAGTNNKAEAMAFVEFLESDEAQAIFEKYGFNKNK